MTGPFLCKYGRPGPRTGKAEGRSAPESSSLVPYAQSADASFANSAADAVVPSRASSQIADPNAAPNLGFEMTDVVPPTGLKRGAAQVQ